MPDIELKFYGENDEVIATHVLRRVKTKFLKSAIRMAHEIGDPKKMDEEQVNVLLNFIVDLFNNKFTRDELEEQTDMIECFSILQSVFARANSLAVQSARTNPTPQSPNKK
jgi:hypothetical protein